MSMSEASQGGERLESVLGTSLQAFEENLSQRTKVPPERIVEFLSCSNAELEQQARVIEEVERRFAILLDRCEKEPDNLGPFMRALDPKAFSRDHDWRSLVLALSRQGPMKHILQQLPSCPIGHAFVSSALLKIVDTPSACALVTSM